MIWLTILGIGDNGLESLTVEARAHLDAAAVVIAPQRVLDQVGLVGKQCEPWIGPLQQTVDHIVARRGQPITILATGDPMYFGIGATLLKHIAVDEMRVIPSPSAFSLAASRMGWALQNCSCISLHGRATSQLHAFLQPNHRILSLTSNQQTVRDVGALMETAGFGASLVSVLEHMGGADERRMTCSAAELTHYDGADFNTLAIDCVADGVWQSAVPGLPDDAFAHDGQLTKREVRAATLAALKPYPDALLWDIGAGCGSVAVEWVRAVRGAKAIALEPKEARRAMIADNKVLLGAGTIEIIAGYAPDALKNLPQPDAIFIGGGLTNEGVFEAAWAALRPQGRLVANAVTLESEAKLVALHAEYGGLLSRISVSRADKVGPYFGWRPFMGVTQWSVDKND